MRFGVSLSTTNHLHSLLFLISRRGFVCVCHAAARNCWIFLFNTFFSFAVSAARLCHLVVYARKIRTSKWKELFDIAQKKKSWRLKKRETKTVSVSEGTTKRYNFFFKKKKDIDFFCALFGHFLSLVTFTIQRICFFFLVPLFLINYFLALCVTVKKRRGERRATTTGEKTWENKWIVLKIWLATKSGRKMWQCTRSSSSIRHIK